MGALDHAAAISHSIAAAGGTIEQAVAAAIGANQNPAPVSSFEIALQNIEQKVVAIESTLSTLSPFLSLIPGLGDIFSRIGAVETIAADAFDLASNAVPIVNAIHAHFGTKIPNMPVSPVTPPEKPVSSPAVAIAISGGTNG
jgi:hypothetical protein